MLSARLLLALVHTIAGRTVVLVEQQVLELEVQHDFGQAQESANDQSPPWKSQL